MILGGSPYPVVPLENLFDLLKSGYWMEKPLSCTRREHVSSRTVSLSFPKSVNQKWFHWYVFVSKNLVFCFEKAYFKPHNDILNALFLNNQPRFGMCRSQNVRLTTLFLNKLIPTLSL